MRKKFLIGLGVLAFLGVWAYIYVSTQTVVDKSSPVYKGGYDWAYGLYTNHPDLLRYILFPEGRCVMEWYFEAERWEKTPSTELERMSNFGTGTVEKQNWEAGCRDAILDTGWTQPPLPT